MAVPKKRMSKTKRNQRRANHMKVPAPAVVLCPNCSEPKLSHRVCKSCGQYDGQKILDVGEE
ncbi:MAG: 50S ribosomal protein L32 [Deltaproteobacteria bacterium]|nr:50S ribosomal protein L32 [Deltaproteobacteria bacterium]